MSKQTDLLNLTDAITVDSSNNVGIGTDSIYAGRKLHVFDSGDAIVRVETTTAGGDGRLELVGDSAGVSQIRFGDEVTVNVGLLTYTHSENSMSFNTTSSEAMRIDSSGNLLVGKTSSSINTEGVDLRADGQNYFVRDGGTPIFVNRKTSDGTIIDFRKDSSTAGSIGTRSNRLYIAADNGSNGGGLYIASAILPTDRVGVLSDNTLDLGNPSYRFDDIYATNGTIQTSDRNEKQDIEALSDAEQRVAVACKGLLRKFRWKDKVAEKGDDARIHFGIIAQDLQDAFAAEGLDAGRYAMFISSTWWEATETYTDDDGVEQTRTDTYETLEEAPEGATERTRFGVRYPELLAFIIGAM